MGFFPTKDMQIPCLSFDSVFMVHAQCAETNEKSISDINFSSYREKFIENWGTKMTITRNIKIWKLIFHSFQHIPHLSCKFGHFKKKNICP